MHHQAKSLRLSNVTQGVNGCEGVIFSLPSFPLSFLPFFILVIVFVVVVAIASARIPASRLRPKLLQRR